MKFIAVFFFSLIVLFGISTAVIAQPQTDSARTMAIAIELQAAMKSSDFAKAATLAKELLQLGMNTSDMYFSAGITTALSGDKPGAIPYFDTAATLGWNNLDNWQTMTGMLGITNDPVIVKSTETVKRNALLNPVANDTDVSPVVHKMYLADQKDRTDMMASGDLGHISQATALTVYRNDSLRRGELYTLIKYNKLTKPRDYYEAALILQHGNDTSDYHNAHILALAAVKGGIKDAKWLVAASMDRFLVAQKKPQKYGTQSFTNKKTGKRELYPVDPSITDEERAKWDCPPLKNALKAAEKIYDKN